MINSQKNNSQKNNFEWPKDLTKNDLKFLKELLQHLKNFDEWKYFHDDVNLKGKRKYFQFN